MRPMQSNYLLINTNSDLSFAFLFRCFLDLPLPISVTSLWSLVKGFWILNLSNMGSNVYQQQFKGESRSHKTSCRCNFSGVSFLSYDFCETLVEGLHFSCHSTIRSKHIIEWFIFYVEYRRNKGKKYFRWKSGGPWPPSIAGPVLYHP